MADDRKNEKYAYLDQLSTEELNELLRADIESPESGDEDVVFHISEVIVQREKMNPTGFFIDVDQAWADFQKYYNTPDGKEQSLYPIEKDGQVVELPVAPSTHQDYKHISVYPIWKRMGIVAAIIVLLFSSMVAVQAAGIDVFGALARWTSEIFQFIPDTNQTNQKDNIEGNTATLEQTTYHDLLKDALKGWGITEQVVPTTFLPDFEMIETKIAKNDILHSVFCSFENMNGEFYDFQIEHFNTANDVGLTTYEKDDGTVEPYTSGSKTFYLFSNINSTMATWSSDHVVITISGNISVDEIKSIIDSIGE